MLKYIILFLISYILLIYFGVSRIYVTKGQELPTIGDVQLIAGRYAFVYNVSSDDLLATLRCESYYGKYQENPNDPFGGSHGIAQFRQSTFDKYSKEAGIKDGNIYDYDDSIKTMAYMISKGRGNSWSCFRRLSTS